MPQSLLRLVKRCAEFRDKKDVSKLPHQLRGIYVLYQCDSGLDKYNVVYVGMAKAGRYGGT
jgi:hypothetical protein